MSFQAGRLALGLLRLLQRALDAVADDGGLGQAACRRLLLDFPQQDFRQLQGKSRHAAKGTTCCCTWQYLVPALDRRAANSFQRSYKRIASAFCGRDRGVRRADATAFRVEGHSPTSSQRRTTRLPCSSGWSNAGLSDAIHSGLRLRPELSFQEQCLFFSGFERRGERTCGSPGLQRS